MNTKLKRGWGKKKKLVSEISEASYTPFISYRKVKGRTLTLLFYY